MIRFREVTPLFYPSLLRFPLACFIPLLKKKRKHIITGERERERVATVRWEELWLINCQGGRTETFEFCSLALRKRHIRLEDNELLVVRWEIVWGKDLLIDFWILFERDSREWSIRRNFSIFLNFKNRQFILIIAL